MGVKALAPPNPMRGHRCHPHSSGEENAQGETAQYQVGELGRDQKGFSREMGFIRFGVF